MAVDPHNKASLLLPSQYNYYTDDDNILSTDGYKPTKQNCSAFFGSSDFGSLMSSPTESEVHSTESGSDRDDDYIAELSRQMAHHMLQDDDDDHDHEKSTVGPALSSSQEKESMMDKFEMQESEEEIYRYDKESSWLKTTSSVLSKPEVSNSEFQSKQALFDYLTRAIQFHKFKLEKIRKQKECLYRAKPANLYKQKEPKKQVLDQFQNNGKANGNYGRQKVSWANTKQQKNRSGSEMRAAFLCESDSRSESRGGTGVFLPRGSGNSFGSRKRTGCSTVLMPARVVQALRLHFDKMGVTSRSNGVIFPLQYDALTGDVRYSVGLQQKDQSRTAPAMNCHQETTGLPQEWTY